METSDEEAVVEKRAVDHEAKHKRDGLPQSRAEIEVLILDMEREDKVSQNDHVEEEEGNEDDRIQNELQAFILERNKDRSLSESDPSFASDSRIESISVNSEEEAYDGLLDDRPSVVHMPSAEEMDAGRQRTLRDIAVHDKIGGDYIPEVRMPTELIDKLRKRREEAVRYAKEIRAPFEKFQDFDAFIDDITITDDQSWKTIRIDTKHIP